MPKRNFTKKLKKRFTKKRKGNRRTLRTAMTRGLRNTRQALTNFPDSKVVNMRFSRGVTLNAPAGPQVTSTFYRLGNIVVPDELTADNALGFAQWRQFYKAWTVTKCEFDIMYTSSSNLDAVGVGAVPMIVGFQVVGPRDANSTLPPSTSPAIDALIGSGNCKWRILQDAGNGNVVRLKGFYSPAAWHSVHDVQDADQLKGTFGDEVTAGRGPGIETFLRVFVVANDAADNPGPISFRITLNYTVVCDTPRELLITEVPV